MKRRLAVWLYSQAIRIDPAIAAIIDQHIRRTVALEQQAARQARRASQARLAAHRQTVAERASRQ